jgi:membrane-associated protein
MSPGLTGLTAGTVYLVVLVQVFVESGLLLGFFLPGDSVLFTAGLLAAEPGSALRLDLLVIGVFVAAAAGELAGVGRMPYPRFLSANLVGAGIWGSGPVILGYLGHALPWVKWTAYLVAAIAIVISIVAPIVGRLRQRRPAAERPDPTG